MAVRHQPTSLLDWRLSNAKYLEQFGMISGSSSIPALGMGGKWAVHQFDRRRPWIGWQISAGRMRHQKFRKKLILFGRYMNPTG